MPRTPNTPCAVCGKLLWPTNKTRDKSSGQTCHPCRRATVKHGTYHAYYRKGCRCDECRMSMSARVSHIPVSVRQEVYERDNWVCQLCGEPVDVTLPANHPLSATLDHIECKSWVLVPDDTARNLRLAHMACNSSRRDRAS